MQVRVCPKCKAQNRPTSVACSNCYASLEAVPVTEGSAPPPVSAAIAPPAPRPARTTGATPRQQMGVPQQTQMGPMSPPPGMPAQPTQYRMPPPAKRSSAGIIVFVTLVVLAAIGTLVFAVTKSGLLKSEPLPTESPAKAALHFLEAKKTLDLSKVEPYLSRHSIEMIHNTLSSKQAQSAGFSSKDAENMLLFDLSPTKSEMEDKLVAATEVKGDKDADEHTAIVSVVIDSKPEPAPAPKPLLPPGVTPPPEPEKKVDFSKLFDTGPLEVQFVLVAEEGRWKVDIGQTNRRALGLGRPGNPFRAGK